MHFSIARCTFLFCFHYWKKQSPNIYNPCVLGYTRGVKNRKLPSQEREEFICRNLKRIKNLIL